MSFHKPTQLADHAYPSRGNGVTIDEAPQVLSKLPGDSPACGHYVIVSHPRHWYAESGLGTQPNPLSAVALVTKLKHYIVAKEQDPQSVVRRHGLSVHECS